MLFQVFNGHKSILKIAVDKTRRRFLWHCGGGFPAAIQPLPPGLLRRSRLILIENPGHPSLPAGWLNKHARFPANFLNMAKIPARINFKIRARPAMLPNVDYCRRKCDCPKSEVLLT
jgi:hypothetical protein